MISAWWLIPAGMAGALIGAAAMAMFAMASKQDEREEKREAEEP